MKIAHHYWHENGNLGDRLIALGTQNLCRKFLGECSFEIFPISTLPLARDEEVKRLNSCDFLIVGGGGIIGWYPVFQKYLDKIKIPMIVYGVGLNLFRTKESKEILDDLRKKNLEKMLEKAIYFSVRNDGSKEMLSEIGIKIENESPDPIFWVTLNREINRNRVASSKYVIIQIAGDFLWERYAYNKILPITFCKKIRTVVEFLIEKGYKVQFSVHQIIEYPDSLTNDEICFPYLRGLEDYIIPWDWRECINDLNLTLNYYSCSDMVIAMRSHSLLTGIATYRPSISLETQNKNLYYMRKMGLEKYSIPVGHPRFEDELKDLISNVEENWHELSSYNRKVCSGLFLKAERDFKEIKERLNI